MYRPLALFFLLIYSIIIIIVIIIRSYVYRWPKMMIEKLPVMGYSIATDMDGTSYRYTQWVGYNYSTGGCETCMDWSDQYGTELYNLTADHGEGRNLHGSAMVNQIEAKLSSMLRAGWRAL